MLRSKLGYLMFIFVVVLSGNGYSQGYSDTLQQHTLPIALENTIWAGTDSDGDFYEFTFLQGGKVRYKSNTSRSDTVEFNDPEDNWFLNDSTIVILLGNTSVRVGVVHQNSISGQAWNFNGRRWTWILFRKWE